MAAYSIAQMEESLTEEVVVPQAAAKPWKRFGLVAAVLGCVGGVVAMTRPQELTPMQQMQQMAHTGHAFMQAVALRALADNGHSTSVDLGMTFAPEGEEPNAMSMKAYLQPAKEEGKKSAAVIVTFKAKEGSGEDLKTQFEKALTAAKEHVGSAEGGGEEAAAVFDLVAVSNEEDKVHLRITPPGPLPEVPEEDKKTLEEGMQAKPTLELELSTGRDFQQMVDNIHGCEATLPGGIKISATTKLATAIVSTVEDMGAQLGARQHGREIHQAKMMLKEAEAVAAFSSFSSQSTVRYNPEKLEAAACPQSEEEKEHKKKQIEFMKGMMPHLLGHNLGAGTVKELAGLSEHADSLHSIRVVGALPDGYELHAEFKDVKLTPVITELLAPSAGAKFGQQ